MLRSRSTCGRCISSAARLVVVIPASLVAGSLGNGLGILLVLVDSPVKYVVVLERLADEEVTEDLAEIGIVGLVVESQGSSIVQVDGEFVREASAQDLSWCSHLLLHNPVIFLLLRSRLQALPWEGSTTEVEHHVSERLHIVTARLFDPKMRVDTGVPSRSCQVLVFAVWNVEMRLRVAVFLCKTEIDYIDLVAAFTNTHQEVVWFDITMDEGFGVDVLDARDKLVGKKQDSLQGEFAVAEIEEIFQTRTQKIEHHCVIVTFGTKPANEGNANTACQGLVDTSFILELRVLGFDAFELDGNFLARYDVGA